MFKVALYGSTLAAAFFFAGWEMRIKSRLIEEIDGRAEHVSDMSTLDNIRIRIGDEARLGSLLPDRLKMLRIAVFTKFLFVAALLIEIVVLQR